MSGNFPQSKGSDSANEQARAARAAELGLPESATWEDITNHNNEQDRVATAARLGLPESATWADINEQARAARAAETGAAIRTLEQ